MNTHLQRRQGFTLVEVLTVFAIVAVIAAILFPVFAHVREKGRQTVCASNLRQLGLAIAAYTQDYDERHPTSTTVPPFIGLPAFQTSTGWAGLIYPYVKNTPLFHCPTDATPDVAAVPSRVPVSYALNLNLAPATLSNFTAPSRTVLLFEVADDQAAVTLPDEGIENAVPQLSAAGDGVNGVLLNLTGLGSVKIDGAVYATGQMDNTGSAALLPFDQYRETEGRHSGGSNFLLADGHVAWRKGSAVSAGGNALASANAQTATGCQIHSLGSTGGYPCAEGAAGGNHALTFSVP